MPMYDARFAFYHECMVRVLEHLRLEHLRVRRAPGESFVAVVPPQAFFLVSAIFHYLGPAFAVLLFANVSVVGVAWLRIATAAVVFAAWRRPWRLFVRGSWAQRGVLLALGVVLGMMNVCF